MLEKKGKRFRKLLLYVFFGPFRWREIGEPLTIVKVWNKHLKAPFCILFWIRLDYIFGMVLCQC